jgi:hypothetical protein
MNSFKVVCSLRFMSLYLMTMILFPNICHAYFQSKGDEGNFLQAGYKVALNRSENTFALYDDIHSKGTGKKQIIFPKSKYFIPVDLISVAFPLPVVFYSHTTTENAVADLLYANLKLKQLMEEYEKIHAKSKKIIKSADTVSPSDVKDFSQHRDNTYSIYNISRSLKESSVKIGETNRNFSNFSAQALSSRKSDSFKPSFALQMNDRGSFRASGYRPSDGGGKAFNNSIDNGESMPSEDGNNLSATEKVKPDRRRQNVEISDFTDTVNRIILYLIKNKGEAVFYIIGLYFILLFFSAIFRRV